jgi:hypothetical protein
MNDEQQDSFELFADTLTITFGSIIFIALLLVAVTRSHEIEQSGLSHFERRSELLVRQIQVGEDALAAARLELDQALLQDEQRAAQRLGEYETAAKAALHGFFSQTEPNLANALAAENIRSQLFEIRFPWMAETISRNIASLDQRIRRANAEARKGAIARSVLREEKLDVRKQPIYFILKGEALYPVTDGPGGKNLYVSWTRVSLPNVPASRVKYQVSPKVGTGFESSQAWYALQKQIKNLTRDSEFQVSLLVFEDSFGLARELIKGLIQKEVNFSWIPYEIDKEIRMSGEGIRPVSF